MKPIGWNPGSKKTVIASSYQKQTERLFGGQFFMELTDGKGKKQKLTGKNAEGYSLKDSAGKMQEKLRQEDAPK